MNFIEYLPTIDKALTTLKFSSNYISQNENFDYQAIGLVNLRSAINLIEEIPFIQDEIKLLKNSWLFASRSDAQQITSSENRVIDTLITELQIKLNTFKQIAESSNLFDGGEKILIKIPHLDSFDDLQKYANDFKKAIEIPIIDESIGGKVTILSADEGSIIFYVSLGTIAAVKLVAGICWAAAVVKKKRAEAKMFEEHAKTLELKNDMMSTFIDAQKNQLKNILEAEATAIASEKYDHKEPETIERLKLSISTVADLIDKGVQILPVSKEEDLQRSFPDYKNLELIESVIKQIEAKN